MCRCLLAVGPHGKLQKMNINRVIGVFPSSVPIFRYIYFHVCHPLSPASLFFPFILSYHLIPHFTHW